MMSITIGLSPIEEARCRSEARRVGMDVEEWVRQVLAGRRAPPLGENYSEEWTEEDVRDLTRHVLLRAGRSLDDEDV